MVYLARILVATSGRKPAILADMRLPSGDSLLVQIFDASLADAAGRAGERLACRTGCTQCCHGAFVLSPLDVLRLRAGMDTLRASKPDLAAEIEHRAGMWVVEHGPEFPGDPQTGLLGNSKVDRERFEGFANEAVCPALDPASGRCDVYAWRPMTCRIFGPPVRMGDGEALVHCELCFVGASTDEVAACEMTVPSDLEAELLDEIPSKDETVVAFALLG
jgi:Fe-S-cluster containining protein